MINDLVDREAIVKYIQERRNEDGGYTFCQGAESNAQDTYYATETLRKLGAQPRNVKRTITFMQSLQHTDGSFDSVKVAYYVATVLSRLGAGLTKPISNFVESLRSLIGKFNNREVHVEASSEFETLYYTVELLKKYSSLRNAIPLQKRLFEMQNSDGSFGDKRFSRIASTFYALKILKLLGAMLGDCTVFYDGSDNAKFHPEDLQLNLKYLLPSWFLKTHIMELWRLRF